MIKLEKASVLVEGDLAEAGAQTIFLCRQKRKLVVLEKCLDGYMNANALKKKRSVCYRCSDGRKNRQAFQESAVGEISLEDVKYVRPDPAKRPAKTEAVTAKILETLGQDGKEDVAELGEDQDLLDLELGKVQEKAGTNEEQKIPDVSAEDLNFACRALLSLQSNNPDRWVETRFLITRLDDNGVRIFKQLKKQGLIEVTKDNLACRLTKMGAVQAGVAGEWIFSLLVEKKIEELRQKRREEACMAKKVLTDNAYRKVLKVLHAIIPVGKKFTQRELIRLPLTPANVALRVCEGAGNLAEALQRAETEQYLLKEGAEYCWAKGGREKFESLPPVGTVEIDAELNRVVYLQCSEALSKRCRPGQELSVKNVAELFSDLLPQEDGYNGFMAHLVLVRWCLDGLVHQHPSRAGIYFRVANDDLKVALGRLQRDGGVEEKGETNRGAEEMAEEIGAPAAVTEERVEAVVVRPQPPKPFHEMTLKERVRWIYDYCHGESLDWNNLPWNELGWPSAQSLQRLFITLESDHNLVEIQQQTEGDRVTGSSVIWRENPHEYEDWAIRNPSPSRSVFPPTAPSEKRAAEGGDNGGQEDALTVGQEVDLSKVKPVGSNEPMGRLERLQRIFVAVNGRELDGKSAFRISGTGTEGSAFQYFLWAKKEGWVSMAGSFTYNQESSKRWSLRWTEKAKKELRDLQPPQTVGLGRKMGPRKKAATFDNVPPPSATAVLKKRAERGIETTAPPPVSSSPPPAGAFSQLQAQVRDLEQKLVNLEARLSVLERLLHNQAVIRIRSVLKDFTPEEKAEIIRDIVNNGK
ncbi:MAG: hypothetical protein UT86_C0001G0098 [Candidatus Magasanikbacteria bacterium GW2011_GWC2_40_17]|uniref:Uncharacterized protein n=1 Tax=Candidatus Magasanikbacteria bacterium GW2011_GWA2_42_32 TaxID=1619039 RepID=A0A0G1D5X1_9BACT|nr:MAG: hypothetical protein UT86_C0001G0098 [Candidatus Magasanikbacteria bacterium GW2011_GWC2_40_17]KKS57458.1 MAG: hypothetical protein UV20_C0001G0098 [Candidatus Magasanikbacteria bacterium GW2011_GWA2_42_32]OGH85178.1 MAG: hypothetical protein A2294_00300 [Candidatus Magasanikbacteria bacterium RIFOXYB2_FULL_38_10]